MKGWVHMKFYNIDQLVKKNADVNFSIGGRCSGKSYQMAKFLLNHWLGTGKKFVRAVRNWLYAKGLENYFDEVVYNEELPVEVRFKSNKYYIRKLDDNGSPVGSEEVFGYCEIISTEQTKKSVQFPDVDIMFLEEFVAADALDYACGSFEMEWFHFKSLVSTVFRKREGKLFFIGNSMDVNNPYFEKFGVKPENLKLGQIKVFQNDFSVGEKKIKGQKVAVEVVPVGWDNLEEIPLLLRLPDNDIATSGDVTVPKTVLQGAIKFYHDGESVRWFTFNNGLNVWSPLIADWCWYRGNPSEVWRRTDDKFRKYLTITDYNGNVIIAEVPEIENCDCIEDFTGYESEVYAVPFGDLAGRTNGDLASLWGTGVKAVFYNDMLTRYDYITDRLEVVEQQNEARRLGYNSCPETEVVKDHKNMMSSVGLAGYRKRSTMDGANDYFELLERIKGNIE